jgi:hypothetical protein
LLESELKSDPKFAQRENSKENSKELQDLLERKKLMDQERNDGADNGSELSNLRSKIFAIKKKELDKSRKLSVELERIKARHRNRLLITSDVM